MVLHGIDTFPQSVDGFVEIGMGIVEATGDLNLREQLLARGAKRRVG